MPNSTAFERTHDIAVCADSFITSPSLPVKEILPFPDDNGIETYLEEVKKERVKMKMLVERRNELNERIKKLEKPRPSVIMGTPKSFEINLESKTIDQLIEEKEQLERELLDCKKEI